MSARIANIYPHAVIRASERLGLDICAEDVRQVLLDITDTVAGVRSGALMLRREPAREAFHFDREIWGVNLAGYEVRIVWEPETACIVTILGSLVGHPPEVRPLALQHAVEPV